MQAMSKRNDRAIGDAIARRATSFKQLVMGPRRRQTVQRGRRAQSLRAQCEAVEALQMPLECVSLCARKREEEERRGTQNSVRSSRQLPHLNRVDAAAAEKV